MRAVVYARFSTELQSASSLDDQVRLCRERIEQDGHELVNVYKDRAMSGASLMRPGIQSLMQDASRGAFDLVYAEALDRISRDQEDVAGFFKRLRFANVMIMTLAEGEISELHVGLKGTMNALFLKDLADKTRRGLRGRVEAGRSGGGNAYGYDVVRTSSDGTVEAGERRINIAAAKVVHRIFWDYGHGVSPREIAKTLNREGILGPSGATWGPSTINGNRGRGTGILNNELYIGKLVWNRLRYIKDPTTGRRRSRLNSEKEWIIKDVPELRIIPQELWDAAKMRQGEMTRNTRPDTRRKAFWQLQRPRHLLSGLMKCGACGAGYTKCGLHRFGCAAARDRATCTNSLTIHGGEIEMTILAGLKQRLMDPALFEEFVREFTAEVNRQRSALAGEKKTLKGELERVTGQIGKLVDAIVMGADALALNAKLKQLEGQRATLENKLATAPDAEPLIHPVLATIYRDTVEKLENSLHGPDTGPEAFQLLRGLIDAVVLTPVDGNLVIELRGDLAGILALSGAGKASAFSPKEKALQIKMVAGTCNHREFTLPPITI
jgi:site-specific DNA recombinase